MTSATASTGGLLHPEWVAGRRLWMDSAMTNLIDKVHHGDPVRGWEGDPRLSVYWDGATERWELWRLEDDNQYRFVCRSEPNAIFDERLIDALLSWDRQRRRRSLHDEITEHNDRVRDTARAETDEYMTEEVAPRLHYAITRNG